MHSHFESQASTTGHLAHPPHLQSTDVVNQCIHHFTTQTEIVDWNRLVFECGKNQSLFFVWTLFVRFAHMQSDRCRPHNLRGAIA